MTREAFAQACAAAALAITVSGVAGRLPAQRIEQSALRYAIEAEFMPDSGVVVVRSRITTPATALSASGELALRMPSAIVRASGGPVVASIRVLDDHGAPLSAHAGPDSATVIVLPPVAGGNRPTTIEVSVEYRASLDPSDLKQLGYYLFSSTSADDAWYPDVSGISRSAGRFRDFDVTVAYPAGWTIVTSGAGASSDSSSGIIRSRYHAQHIEGFALAAGYGYSITTIDRDGVRILAFAPPPLAAKLRSVAEGAGDAIDWYRHAYGFFPVPQLAIVPGAERASGGFPMSNLFMIHRGDLSADFVRWITAHEVGHYYWGLYTLDPDERLGWLTLGNSLWADHLYLAQRLGIPLAQAWRMGVQSNTFLDFAVAQSGNYEQRLGIRPPAEDSLAFDYNSLVRHGKASVGIYLLARRMGSDSFLAVQRGILADYAYRELPESAFVNRLVRAGIADAQDFIDAWRRGDARIGYTINSVRPDSAAGKNAYQIVIERTGTVAAAVTVDARSRSGRVVHHTFRGIADLDTATVTLDSPVAAVSLDAAGELPMWESSNPDIRRLFIRAIYDAGNRDAFLDVAMPWLRTHQDVELRALTITRLFNTGRYDQVVAMTRPALNALDCSTRTACRATILVARALARVGLSPPATELLERIHSKVAEFAADKLWAQASAEVRSARRP